MKRSADTQEAANVDKKLKLNGHTVKATSVSSKPKSAEVLDPYSYLHGFGAEHQSEAIEGVLPIGQNNPQKCAYGLYAEQLSGTSFTTPRVKNQRSWLYRIRPTVSHTNLTPLPDANPRIINEFSSQVVYPNQMRWHPYHMPSGEKQIDFIDGLSTIGGSGSPDTKTGFAIHIYTCNTSMGKRVMINSDGDLLIVPQIGILTIRTEFGYLYVPPRQIAVIQRGMAFHIDVSEASRGYICEVYSSHFTLPDLGPIGANGLASPRDFQYPVASYEYVKEDWDIVQKFLGKLFIGHRQTSPFDVVGWHGNYIPYKYDLDKFIPVGALRVDHMDPSIFTVLTAPTNEPGVAAIDFVIFPPRWAVQENTFRPPYYHRNCMTEYMGNIAGAYDAKPKGFQPGAGSLHSVAMGHGPDAAAYQHASTMSLSPIYMSNDALAFMFESTYIMKLTEWAIKEAPVDHDYVKCWADLPVEWESHGLPTSGQAGRHNEPMTTTTSSSSSSSS